MYDSNTAILHTETMASSCFMTFEWMTNIFRIYIIYTHQNLHWFATVVVAFSITKVTLTFFSPQCTDEENRGDCGSHRWEKKLFRLAPLIMINSTSVDTDGKMLSWTDGLMKFSCLSLQPWCSSFLEHVKLFDVHPWILPEVLFVLSELLNGNQESHFYAIVGSYNVDLSAWGHPL